MLGSVAKFRAVKSDRHNYTYHDLNDQHSIYFLRKMKMKHGLFHVTHSGGFVQQELEGVVCCLRGFQFSVTECYQIVFHVLVNPAIQGLSRDGEKESQDRGDALDNLIFQIFKKKKKKKLRHFGNLHSSLPNPCNFWQLQYKIFFLSFTTYFLKYFTDTCSKASCIVMLSTLCFFGVLFFSGKL